MSDPKAENLAEAFETYARVTLSQIRCAWLMALLALASTAGLWVYVLRGQR